MVGEPSVRYTPAQLRWKHLNHSPDLVGCGLLVVAGAVFCLFAGGLLRGEVRYLTGGATTDATVLDKRLAAGRRPAAAAVLAHGGGRKGPRYLARYEFTDAAGQVHQGQASFDKAVWDGLQPGAAFAVEYLRDQPTVNQPYNPARPLLWLGLGLAALGGLLVGGGLLLLGGEWRAIAERVRLTADGTPVLGLVEEVRRTKPRKGGPVVTVGYRYLAPGADGAPHLYAGEFSGAERWMRSWAAGAPLLVLVDPDDPARHAPDRFHARSDDLERLCRPAALPGED
jgi:hypothetical protein